MPMALNLKGHCALLCVVSWFALVCVLSVSAENPYRHYTFNVTYGYVEPLGVRQRVIMINGQFPGPDIYAVTNDNLLVNMVNHLDEPFLMSWDGIQQRKNSYVDGMYGTTCPIPPGRNYTYIMQVKDQIGSFFYFPSTAFHKAAGGYGAICILSRPMIPVPFPELAADYTLLIGDWYTTDHQKLKAVLDYGKRLMKPDGILINGQGHNNATFTVQKGETYRFRISNVGLEHTLNIRFQGHKMKLIEVEGTHTMQQFYSSLDVHVGQSYSVLVTADQPVDQYYIAVSSRFGGKQAITTTAVLRYHGSTGLVSGLVPEGPTDIEWSLNQALSIRTNLTASGPRPNPQGSYHYGQINVTRTIKLVSTANIVDHKQRYAINGVSFVPGDTPLKLADHLNISGVFRVGNMPDHPTGKAVRLDTAVLGADYRDFVEIVFENLEPIVQSWHLDGYNFWVVGMDRGRWNPEKRKQYNLNDAISRCTTQVYPRSWTAIYVSLDNVGMWNLRTQFWARQYLGEQFYLRVYTDSHSLRDELPMPQNTLLCGRALPGNH